MVTVIKHAKDVNLGDKIRWVNGDFVSVTSTNELEQFVYIEVNDCFLTVNRWENIEVQAEKDKRYV